jgi:prepilin-type N-terminal cleavage/methylation domain-containing protein
MKTYSYLPAATHPQGFTLVELVVGLVVTSITIAVAGAAFVTVAQASAKSDIEIDRRADLNRATDFIADDIRESSSVSTTTPSGWTVPTGYTPVFYLTRPSAPTTVAYYTRNAAGTGWQNQLVIYRATVSNDPGQPLADGLANNNPGCAGGSATNGFQVVPASLTPATRQVTLCLAGYVPNSTNIQVKGQSGPRSSSP